MMSLDVIAALNREMGREAARARREPYVIVSQAEIQGYERLPFPNLGGYVPPGWREVARFFLDRSGRGDGFAMGLADLKKRLRPGRGYAVVEAGPFQAYIGEFEWVGTAPAFPPAPPPADAEGGSAPLRAAARDLGGVGG